MEHFCNKFEMIFNLNLNLIFDVKSVTNAALFFAQHCIATAETIYLCMKKSHKSVGHVFAIYSFFHLQFF